MRDYLIEAHNCFVNRIAFLLAPLFMELIHPLQETLNDNGFIA